MKQRIFFLLTFILAGFSMSAQNGVSELGLNFNTESKNDLTIEAQADGSWQITTTGTAPYCDLTALARALNAEEKCLVFEYESAEGLSGAQLSFSPFGEGRTLSFDLPAAAEWTEAEVDIAGKAKAFNWGASGDCLRINFGTAADAMFRIRNIRITTEAVAPMNELEGLKLGRDGYYLLSTADELETFANYVNQGKSADARLVNDIDYTEKQTQIGTSSNYFNATFDGAEHSITLNLITTEESVGLFKHLNGVVKNLVTKGDITTSAKFAGGVASHTYNATIKDCVSLVHIHSSLSGDGTHAGFVGCSEVTLVLENCIFAGKMSSGKKTSNCGGLTGWLTGTVTMNSCIFFGDMEDMGTNDSWTFTRNAGKCIFNNCYYVRPFGGVHDKTSQFIGGEPEEVIANGMACFQMNGGQEDIHWYQNIGEDPFPVPFPSHKRVYGVGATYRCDGKVLSAPTSCSNEPQGDIDLPAHKYHNGICTVCGGKDAGFVETVDGWYELKTPEQLAWFAQMNNAGADELKVRLMNDIDMTGIDFTPIGSNESNAFRGIFDGGGHTIKGLKVNCSDRYAGLIGCIEAPATVKNLTLDATCTINGTTSCGIIGESRNRAGELFLTNLGNEGTVTGNDWVSGILGRCYSPGATLHLQNCYMSGHVKGGGWGVSQICFDCGAAGTAENCFACGTSEGGSTDGTWFANGTCTYTNCWSINGKSDNFKNFTAEQAASGELAYILNGSTFKHPTWYQTIGEDKYPVLNSSHGIVFKTNDGYADLHDAESFLQFRQSVVATEYDYVNSLVATVNMKDEYMDKLQSLSAIDNADEFLDTYYAMEDDMKALNVSASAYKAYKDKADLVIKYLDANPEFQGEDRNYLESYVATEIEPNDEFPNGSYPYIYKNALLTTQEVMTETQFLQNMLVQIIGQGYLPGSDISVLVYNADFTNGWDGWQGQRGTAFDNTGVMPIVETVGAQSDSYQTLTGLKEGYYEVSINGLSRTAGIDGSRMYSAILYANDLRMPLMNLQEDALAKSEAANMVNCYITNAPSYPSDNILNDSYYYTASNIGAPYAFNAGRYTQHLVAKVDASGTLTIGFAQRGSGYANDWMIVSNVKLRYFGSAEECGDGIRATLDDYVARANSLLNAEVSADMSTDCTPNFHAKLRESLQAAIEAAGKANGAAEMYAVAETFTSLFHQIFTCQLAYIELLKQIDNYTAQYAKLKETGLIEEAEFNEFTKALNDITEGYFTGAYSAEEASGMKFPAPEFDLTKPLIVSADQLSSNASDIDEGKHIEWLIDKNPSTFWHTDWHGNCHDPYHYLQVDLRQEMKGKMLAQVTRRDAGHANPTEMRILGSTDGVNFTDVATMTLPYDGPGTTVLSKFELNTEVRYLRFTPTNTNTGVTTYWHTAEFQLYGSEQTAIKDIVSDNPYVNGIYNVAGQKLQKAQKGLNIVDGKKVILK